MKQEDQADQCYYNKLFDQLVSEIPDCPMNQCRPVVCLYNFYAWWQSGFQFFKFLFYPRDRGQGIFSIAHHDNATGNFSLTIQICSHAAHFRADLYGRKISQQYGRALISDVYRDGFDITRVGQVTTGANHIFGLGEFND